MKGTEDLEVVETVVVDTRRDPDARLNWWLLTVIDGLAGMPRRMIPFFVFLLEDMVVPGQGAGPSHALKGVFI